MFKIVYDAPEHSTGEPRTYVWEVRSNQYMAEAEAASLTERNILDHRTSDFRVEPATLADIFAAATTLDHDAENPVLKATYNGLRDAAFAEAQS